MPQSPSKEEPWDLTVLPMPSTAPVYFPESYQQSEISFLSKVILVLSQGTKSELGGGGAALSHLGDLMFCQKTLHES